MCEIARDCTYVDNSFLIFFYVSVIVILVNFNFILLLSSLLLFYFIAFCFSVVLCSAQNIFVTVARQFNAKHHIIVNVIRESKQTPVRCVHISFSIVFRLRLPQYSDRFKRIAHAISFRCCTHLIYCWYDREMHR